MPSVAEMLERESETVDLEYGQFERLLRRRDRKRRNQRIGAGVLAIIISLVSFVALTRAFSTAKRPADESPPRRDGEIITYTGDDPRHVGDLVAQDAATGEVRTLVVPDARDLIGSAAWSADGRWAAYEVVACPSGPPRMTAGFTHSAEATGLWVTNGRDEPRQLTRPCFEDPDVAPYNELWAWSPAGAQLVVARRSIDGDSLVLIDPATGDLTHLGDAAGRVTALTWSPDGTRITYAARGGGGSVYSVGVGDGEQSLLASSLGYVSGGLVFGWNIQWSPDDAHIVVQTLVRREAPPYPDNLFLMNADGSDLHQLAKDVDVQDTYLSPGLSWSPDGTRMAYATFSGGREQRQIQIWTGSPDGSAPSLLFESTAPPLEAGGSPIWSPDGTQIAFEHTTSDGEAAWLVMNADGTGDAREIDELQYLSWRGGWYFCQCYG